MSVYVDRRNVMRERTGDLFDAAREADALVITTNGFVKQDGCAVMGRGVAKQAAERWPWLPRSLGRSLSGRRGNHVTHFTTVGAPWIVPFPVKHHWKEAADRALIVRSAGELVELADEVGWRTVVLPRPGCGNGRLCWEQCADTCLGEPVKGLLEGILDDRFVVVCNEVDATAPSGKE